MESTNLVAWLPFNSSVTEDLCGNEWTIVGSLAIEDGALALESSSTRNYIYTTPPELGMSDFTIDWWEYIPASVNSFTGEVIGIDGTTGSNTYCLALMYWSNSAPSMDLGRGTGASWSFENKSIGTKIRDQWVHRAVVRSGNTIYAFENGTLFTSVSFSYSISVSGSSLFIGNFARENRQFVGKLKNVRIHVGAALWTGNFTPPTAEDYAELQTVINEQDIEYIFRVDVERGIRNDVRFVDTLKVWLPFDTSPTADLCGNSWTGAAALKVVLDDTINQHALQCVSGSGGIWNLNSSPLFMSNLTFGGTDFTIRGWFKLNQGSTLNPGCRVFALHDSNRTNAGSIYLNRDCYGTSIQLQCLGTSTASVAITFGERYFYEVDYNYYEGTLRLFLDGTLKASLNVTIPRTTFARVELGYSYWGADTPNGMLGEFQIYDGFALHTENFTPTKVIDFETVFADVEYESTNDALAWRYEDCAVYIGTGKPINFHVPKAYELWIKFDVYFDGVARWYAYDDGFEGMTGITALTTLALDYLSAGATVKTLPDVCKTKQTQTFLVHMVSGTTNGLIEVWVGLEQFESFSGNVNNGRPFVDFMLRSDDAGTSFTELIVSNTKLNPDEKPANVLRATKTSQLNVCNTETGVIWLLPGGDYPFPYITYTIREVIRQTIEETVDIGEAILQPINSVWAKFDIFNDGINRWWFYNLDENFGKSGVCALANGDVNFIANEAEVQQEANLCAVGQWQSFIVHMESDEINGLIEITTDNVSYTYTGNVNGGKEFTDVYLLSESDKVVFDNFIVSTAPLDFDTKLKRVKTTETANPTLALNVHHNGENILIPFKLSAVPILNATAIRWLGADWYNKLVEFSAPLASEIPIFHDGKLYALSKE